MLSRDLLVVAAVMRLWRALKMCHKESCSCSLAAAMEETAHERWLSLEVISVDLVVRGRHCYLVYATDQPKVRLP